MCPTMTHPTYRPAGPVRYLVAETSLGSALVAASPRGVCAILLGSRPEELVRDLRRRFPDAILGTGDRRLEQLRERAVRLVDGAPDDLPLDPRGSEFERRVWRAIADIPPAR